MAAHQGNKVVSTVVDSQVAFSPLLRHDTLGEFWELPEPLDRWHYDLIGGVLYMVPPPDPPHGDLDSRLKRWLILFLDANGDAGSVHHPREAIYIDSTNVEPDMMYVSGELAARMGRRRTSADVEFEYLSKSTAVYDRTTKADTYLALGRSGTLADRSHTNHRSAALDRACYRRRSASMGSSGVRRRRISGVALTIRLARIGEPAVRRSCLTG